MEIISIALDKTSSVPIYIQLYEYIRREIKNGGFKPYEKMPSSRSLAKNLNISKNTVDSAYNLLKADSLIISAERSGYFASPEALPPESTAEMPETDPNAPYLYNFSIHNADISNIPYSKWNKALSGIRFADPSLLNYGSRLGDYSLRISIADFLKETAGIICSPHNIILGAGSEYLLQTIDRLLGRDNIYGFENPGHLNYYEVLNNGLGSLRLINTGPDGFNPDELLSSDIKTLCLTPEHQIPTGFLMPLKKRIELLDWAAASQDRYIIENSYGSLFGNAKKMPSLFSLDKKGRVIYMGSFSRITAPSLRISFMILPDSLLTRFKSQNRFYRCLVSRYSQAVVYELIKSGLLVSYILTLRKVHREKRELAYSVLQSSPLSSRIKIWPSGGGTHFLMTLSSSLSSDELIQKAKDERIKILALENNMLAPGNNLFPQNTFIMGIDGLSKNRLAEALNRLISIWGKF